MLFRAIFAGISYEYFPHERTMKVSEFSIIIHFLLEVDCVYDAHSPSPRQLGKSEQERKLQVHHMAGQHPLSRPTGHSANGLLYFVIK